MAPAMNRLAVSTSVISASFNSLTSRSRSVPNMRVPAPARFGRIGRVLDAEAIERLANLGQAGLVHLAAGLRREELVAAKIAVEARRQPLPANRFGQGEKARLRARFFDKDSRVDRPAGIFHGDHRVERRLILKLGMK